MSTHDITLYYNIQPGGPAGSVVRLLEYHKNTSVKRQLIDLSKSEQLNPEFTAINPHHTVPTLEDKTTGVVLYESIAIHQYLAEVFGWEGRYGFPKNDLAKKYRVINELHKHPNFLGDLSGNKIGSQLYPSVFRDAPFNFENFTKAVEGVKPTLELFDQKLEKNGGFVAGDEPTIADLRPWIDLFQLSTYGGDATGGIIDFSEYKNISKFLLTVKEDLFDEEAWALMKPFYGRFTSKIGDQYRLAENAAKAKKD